MRPVLIDGRVGLAFAHGGKINRVLIFEFAGETIRDAEIITEADALAELVIEDPPENDSPAGCGLSAVTFDRCVSSYK